ncbi:MAG: hypothetical protein K8T90_21920 [Planctomycetes bacterium]|nr:hypothetical protein [Planctomycetota bacterium]
MAAILGVPEHRLTNLIRHRLIDAPPLVAGRRVWRRANIEAARRVLVARGAIPSVPAGEPRWEPGEIDTGLDPADLAQDLAAEQEHDDDKARRQIARPSAVRA